MKTGAKQGQSDLGRKQEQAFAAQPQAPRPALPDGGKALAQQLGYAAGALRATTPATNSATFVLQMLAAQDGVGNGTADAIDVGQLVGGKDDERNA